MNTPKVSYTEFRSLQSPRSQCSVPVPQNDEVVSRHFSVVHNHENGRTKINVSGSGNSVISFLEERDRVSVQIQKPLLDKNTTQIPSDVGNRYSNLTTPLTFRPSLPGIFSDAAYVCRTRPCLVIGAFIGTVACVAVLYPIISVVMLMLSCSSHSQNTKQVSYKLFC